MTKALARYNRNPIVKQSSAVIPILAVIGLFFLPIWRDPWSLYQIPYRISLFEYIRDEVILHIKRPEHQTAEQAILNAKARHELGLI